MVESAPLLREYTSDGIEGSNPSRSAIRLLDVKIPLLIKVAGFCHYRRSHRSSMLSRLAYYLIRSVGFMELLLQISQIGHKSRSFLSNSALFSKIVVIYASNGKNLATKP